MTAKDAERTDEHSGAPGPWWADLSTWGAVGLIAFGCLVAAWAYFRLPGTPEELPGTYFGTGKVIAVGLVIVGSSVLSRRRSRGGAAEEPNETDRA